MSVTKIILFVILASCLNTSCAQRHSVGHEIGMEERLSISMKTLEMGSGDDIKEAFNKLVFYYCECKSIPNCTSKTDTIYQLILKYRSQIQLYHRYLHLSFMDCLDVSQYAEIQQYLNEHLTEKDEYFYELVGKYQLKKFEPSLRAKADSYFLDELQRRLEVFQDFVDYRYLSGLQEQASIHITLANLGDTLIEQRILKILNTHYQTFDIQSPSIEDAVSQLRFSLEIFDKVLGKLYSIESLKATVNMLDNFQNYDEYVPYIHKYGTYPFNYYYIKYILSPKLNPVFKPQFMNEFDVAGKSFYTTEVNIRYKFKDLTPFAKDYMQKLKQQILNDELEWSSIYEFRASQKKNGK